MSFLVINNTTDYPYKERNSINFKSYETHGRAQAMATRLERKERSAGKQMQGWRVMSYQAWEDEFNPMVEKKNLLTGKPFMGRKYEPACTDPSTETYHCM